MARAASTEEQDPLVVSQMERGAINPKEYPYPVHTVIRGIGAQSNPGQNVFRAEEVGAYLNMWYAEGFRLQSAHHAGESKEGIAGSFAHTMVYVLVKQ